MSAYEKGSIVLDIQEVGLVLGGKQILRNLNGTILDIQRPGMVQGQVVCLLGASGIGKSQLSRLIAGLRTPTSGKILGGDGKQITRGTIGMVPQHYGLFEYLTVEGNLMLALSRGSHGADYFSEMVGILGLRDHLSKYPKQLSGGQRQRAAIARQFLCSEHIVILDEPFSGLDLKMRKRTCDLIVKIAQLHELNTLIVITHDVIEGLSVADTTWLMGVERDETGKVIPGAKIMAEYDLAAIGLAWTPDLVDSPTPFFSECIKEVKVKFLEVSP